MSKMLTLAAADREFWALVSRAAFTNPFSEERAALDQQILGRPVDYYTGEHIEALTQAVGERLRRLEAGGGGDCRRYAASDREVVRTAFLFGVFHQFRAAFDGLILEQMGRGDTSLPVPFSGELLEQMRRRGIERAEAVRYLAVFFQMRRAFHFIARGLVGRSPCLGEFRRRLWNNVFTRDIGLYDRHLWNRMEDFSTLLLGETGAGKGAAAAAIGRSGFIPFDERQNRFAESFTRSFTALNLSQYPETLIESELFGHRKGAFTGAVEAHQGLLARCSPHGAIFLDEIGDVSVPIQIKLLQVLQERTFCPVGSHELVRFRGRVIAATNRPLDRLRAQGLFRDDFYYRLCSDVIEAPTLRQRLREQPHELRLMLAHLVSGMAGGETSGLVDRIEEAIVRGVGRDYAWPGNVRELEQATRRILLTGEYAGSDRGVGPGLREELVEAVAAGTLDADGVLAGYCALLHDRLGSYEAVARQTRLDRRTARKYVQQWGGGGVEASLPRGQGD